MWACLHAGKKLGPAYLFFGCRNRKQDYIYQQELERYEQSGAVDRLFVAFSREGEQKDYVQHHIAREAALVAPLLREGPESQGIFYICGDAKNMAKVGAIWQCCAQKCLILDPGELMQ